MKKSRQKSVPVSELVEINPSISLNGMDETSEVSFIPMSDVTESGRWESRQTRLLKEVRNGYTQFQENDVLFAKITPCMENGKGCHAVGLKNGLGFGTTEFHVLRAKEKTDPRFIFHLTQSIDLRLKAETKMSGSAGQQRVPASFFSEYKIIAFDFAEQAKIAAILTSIDKSIEQTEKLIAKQQRIKRGLLQDLLTKGIDEHGAIRSEATHEFKDSPLGRIPKEWDVLPVERVGDVNLGRQRSPKHQTGRFTTPYLRVANVFDCYIDYSDVLEMDFTPNERILYGLSKGDILLNEGQSLELVGRSAIFEGEENKYCFQNTLIRFRPFPENLSFYCQQVFKFWLDTGKFMDVAKQTTSVAHLGADRFATMLFPKPPAPEQDRISALLQAQDAVTNSCNNHFDKLRAKKNGLMQDLLTGKVRVSGEQTN